MTGRKKTIKVSDEEYLEIIKARDALRKHGTQSLPKDLQKRAESGGDLALGAVIGLFAAGLVGFLIGKATLDDDEDDDDDDDDEDDDEDDDDEE